ncbi:Protein SSUH2 [Araneus ventricosus]|uniref:Protein SSUH2 n=1 Tax=Araneus ventricosus TaxID=182803 RepID=A0A4Y2H716_ARAVE|nr:Protein SSUH2 [Araneus ventricosus]
MDGMQASTSHEEIQQAHSTHAGPSASQIDTSSNIVSLTDEEVRQACYAYANEFCSYGTRFIRDATLTELQNDCAFHYKLETLIEKRETVCKGSICKGSVRLWHEGTNVPESADFGDPWEVPVNTEDGTLDFTDLELIKPGSVSIRDCETCLGKKGRRCFICWGSGYEPCFQCKGTGKTSDYALCRGCDGSGKRSCMECLFKGGMLECKTCKGNGKMMYEKQLIISRKVHADDFISYSSNLPANLIQDADGQELLSESGNRVEPISSALNRAINEVSSALIVKHNQTLTDEKIIAQRHSLRAVPYTKVSYTWRNKKGEFYIYGLQKKVYFQEYPEQWISNLLTSGMNKYSEKSEGAPKAPSAPPAESPPQLRTISVNLPPLTAKELREACYAHAKENICYGSRCIRDMVLTDIQHECLFEYVLQSLCEKRVCEETTTPYFGQKIDGPENGPALHLSEIPISPPEEIVEKQIKTDIPHSSYVKQCGTCIGNKKVHCATCNGNGKVVCGRCGGRRNSNATCFTCADIGMEMCMTCIGIGRTECNTCNGHGKVIHSKTVIVIWRPVYENVISNPANLPKELIPKVNAKEIFREQGKVLQPVNVVPPKEINRASALLIGRHLAFTTEQVVLQRHILRVIPVTKAKYTYQGEEGEFFVYGFERKVYFESYPNACCGCCCWWW